MDNKVTASMIKLLESEKNLVEFMLSVSSVERESIIKEWGLAVVLILSSLKSVVSQPDQGIVSSDLAKLLEDLESTLLELKSGVGYKGPIGQA